MKGVVKDDSVTTLTRQSFHSGESFRNFADGKHAILMYDTNPFVCPLSFIFWKRIQTALNRLLKFIAFVVEKYQWYLHRTNILKHLCIISANMVYYFAVYFAVTAK